VKTALILGGGFAGCAAAHQLQMLGGWDVTLVEANAHLGSGVRTMWRGRHPHTFGPRHFLTQREDVWAYMNDVLPLRRFPGNEMITYVEDDQQFYSYPIHINDLDRMPEGELIKDELQAEAHPGPHANLEEYWIESVGCTLYNKFIDKYSRKMWQVESNTEIDDFAWSPKGTALKSGPRAAWDNAFSGYPYAPNGYDDYFAKATAGVKVIYNCPPIQVDLEMRSVMLESRTWITPDLIVSTISPDLTLPGKPFGYLPYVGRDFHAFVLPIEYALPENVFFAYYAGSEQFTRIVEYKKFTYHKSPHTLLGMEIPRLNGRKDYPLPMKKEQAKAKQYHDTAALDVFFMGRQGSYRYNIDMGPCVEQALELAKQIRSGAGRGVLGERWQ
jgi:UDP-galactopyranose mutase